MISIMTRIFLLLCMILPLMECDSDLNSIGQDEEALEDKENLKSESVASPDGKEGLTDGSQLQCDECPKQNQECPKMSSECSCPEIPSNCQDFENFGPKISDGDNLNSYYGVVLRTGHEMITCDDEENDRITDEEVDKMEKFRDSVQAQMVDASLLHNYTEDPSFVLRWIRGFRKEEHELEDIEELFLEHYNLRQSAKIDEINTNDWTEFAEAYPLSYNGFDRRGRPVAEVYLNEWDIERVILTYKKERLVRWWIRLLEMLTRILNLMDYDDCYKQALMIIDVDGFHPTKHACSSCRHFYYEIMSLMDSNYPDLFAKIIITNANSVFNKVLSVIETAVSNETFSRIEVYYTKEEWLPRVKHFIDSDQRTERFYGMKRDRDGQ